MNIFIGCSASDNIDTIYKDLSKSLISKIALIDNLNLVFGAFNHGIMNICYEEFKNKGKRVVGVSPLIYKDSMKELECDEEIFTSTTMERFNEIYKRCDIFLFLPGGVGTLAEIFNVIEENRTNDNNSKLIIIYNKEFFYTDIIKSLYRMYEERFIDLKLTDYLVIESSEDKVIKMIEERL